MIKCSDLTANIYKTKDVAAMVGVTTKTLREWDSQSPIFKHTKYSNFSYMEKETLIEFLNKKGLLYNDPQDNTRDVVYARVSSHKQKESGDLDRQVLHLVQSCPNLQNALILSEVGNGLNDKRKKFNQLLQMILNDEVNWVFITYKDCLTRFGFHYIETICQHHQVEIVVVNQDDKRQTIEEELANDLMSLIAFFQENSTIYVLIKTERLMVVNNDVDLEIIKMLSELAQLPGGLKIEDIIEMECTLYA